MLITSQIVMVGIMTMTPIHMRAHDHSMGAVGLVIGLHVGSMWLPSLVTGPLVDKVGPRAMAMTGGGILLAAGLVAAFAPGESLTALITALMLLGIGWNVDSCPVPAPDRSRNTARNPSQNPRQHRCLVPDLWCRGRHPLRDTHERNRIRHPHNHWWGPSADYYPRDSPDTTSPPSQCGRLADSELNQKCSSRRDRAHRSWLMYWRSSDSKSTS